MNAVLRTIAVLFCAVGTAPAWCQSLYYVEPGNAACPVHSPPTAAAPRRAQVGTPVPGTLSVKCGFDQGSYTVTLYSTDPGATFSPKSFLVNFGSIGGGGKFTITFATSGVQTLSAIITSNMGSPVVSGRFAGLAHEFSVARP